MVTGSMNKNKIRIIPSSEIYEEFILNQIKNEFLDTVNISYINKAVTINKKQVDSVYVALSGEVPAGFYSIRTSRFHPHSLYFNIIVDVNYRRKKIGTSLYNHMVELKNGFCYLQSSFYETSSAGSAFLKSLGFKLYRTTQEAEIDTGKIRINLEKMNKYSKKHNLNISPFSKIKANEFLEIADIARACYTSSHIDNPVGENKIDLWEKLLKSDLIEEGSFVIKKIIRQLLLH